MPLVCGTARCKCCLQIRPIWLEHGGYSYCSYSCADAWGENLETRGASLVAAARLKHAEELQSPEQERFLREAGIRRCAACTGLTIVEDLVGDRCPACRPGTAEVAIARLRVARAHLEDAAAAIAAGGRR